MTKGLKFSCPYDERKKIKTKKDKKDKKQIYRTFGSKITFFANFFKKLYIHV